MDITQLANAASSTGSAAQLPQTATTLSSDFETFLNMLTAQARYQDPLEPLDSSEYSAQLAQFSMVEQQVQTNDLLNALAVSLGSSNMAALAGWVGMEARAAVPMQFEGQPITVSPNPAAASDRVYLVAMNADGDEVSRREIPITSDAVTWDGLDVFGAPVPHGPYTFMVESQLEGEVILSEPAEVYGRVVEAQSYNNDTILIFEGGTAALASAVTALREAGV